MDSSIFHKLSTNFELDIFNLPKINSTFLLLSGPNNEIFYIFTSAAFSVANVPPPETEEEGFVENNFSSSTLSKGIFSSSIFSKIVSFIYSGFTRVQFTYFIGTFGFCFAFPT